MHSVAPPPSRLERLRENEIDLQIELADLVDEIDRRVNRIADVLALLTDTRRALALLPPETEPRS